MPAAVPKRILIVGFGFLGSAIAAMAAKSNVETRVLARSRPQQAGSRDFVVGDAAEPGLILRHGGDVDHIIYAAGGSVPAAVEADPMADLAQSFPPLLNAIDACGRVGCSLTLLSSGGTIYGNVKTLPIPESQPTNPVGAYGVRNLLVEKHALMQANRLGFNLRILRIGNAYGSSQPLRRSQGIIAALLHSLAHDAPFTVYGDGLAVRDYIHVSDVASAAVQLLSAPPAARIVNVGSGSGRSTLDLISICNSVTGKRVQASFDHSRSFDVAKNVLDISLLRQLIAFNPATPEFAIREMWDRATAESLKQPQR